MVIDDIWSIHEPALAKIADLLGQSPAARLASSGDSAPPPYEFIEPGVAMISISGVLLKSLPWWSDSGVTLPGIAKAVKAAAQDESVKSILLAIDSPGGTVAGTLDVAQAVAEAATKKPVIAYASDLMASAAYWIGAQANKVYASNALTTVGSIGVYGGVVYDTSALAEKAGIKAYVLKAGDAKSFGEFGTKVTPDQLALAQSRIDQIHAHFKASIQAGRKMTAGQVEQVSDGRVYLAADALKVGLIDGIKTLDAVVAELVATSRTQLPAVGQKIMTQAATEGPKAATLSELKAACPGAPSDWILAQLEANATVSAAQAAYIKAQQDEIAKAKADAEKAKAEAAAQVAKKSTGVDPIVGGNASGGGSESSDDPRVAYDAAIRAAMQDGSNRMEARQKVERANPRLVRDYLLATNSPDQHASINEKFKARVK